MRVYAPQMYFEGLGFPCPAEMNPADFYMVCDLDCSRVHLHLLLLGIGVGHVYRGDREH